LQKALERLEKQIETYLEEMDRADEEEDSVEIDGKSMKEKLIAAERQRRDVEEMLINYIGKYDDRDLHRYTELLEELKKDKPK
uniref:hypothetical protein n=1 Tax=Planomicrobium okeanokoites TaxID=244 RepID=UPI0035643A4E